MSRAKQLFAQITILELNLWKSPCQLLSRVRQFATHGLQRIWLLCPWSSPGKNSAVGSHSLLKGIFLIQGSNPHPLHWQVDSSLSEPPSKSLRDGKSHFLLPGLK